MAYHYVLSSFWNNTLGQLDGQDSLLRVWIFKSHFQLTTTEKSSLTSQHVYLCCTQGQVLIKLLLWKTLNFVKSFVHYNFINEVSQAAAMAFCTHLWYVSEELVAQAFFEDNVDKRMKLVETLGQRLATRGM
jgi:hypothetical protein